MRFRYRSIDSAGKAMTGVIPARDLSEARSELKGRGLTVVELDQEETKAPPRRLIGGGVKDSDIYNMVRELSILLKSGIRIDRAFEVLLGSISNPGLKDSVSVILQDIKAGKSVAQAFASAKRFTPLTITMIQAGESSGDLKSAFENIAEHISFQMKFKAEVRNALTYPTFLIFASLVTLLVIFKFIIPRFFSIFGENPAASLPLTARALYAAGNFINLGNIYVLAGGVLLVVLALRMIDTKALFARLYSAVLYVPILGGLVMALELSRFSYSMYSMLNSGIEFINALRMSVDIIQHERLRAALQPSVNRIKEGKGIADVFSQVSMLPDMVSNMLRVGEESGNLKEIFFELYLVYDERFKNSVKRALSLVEPLIITLTGLVVGFIVISLILTVMSAGNIKL